MSFRGLQLILFILFSHCVCSLSFFVNPAPPGATIGGNFGDNVEGVKNHHLRSTDAPTIRLSRITTRQPEKTERRRQEIPIITQGTSTTRSKSNKLPRSAVVGIALGITVAVILATFVTLVIVKRNRNIRREKERLRLESATPGQDRRDPVTPSPLIPSHPFHAKDPGFTNTIPATGFPMYPMDYSKSQWSGTSLGLAAVAAYGTPPAYGQTAAYGYHPGHHHAAAAQPTKPIVSERCELPAEPIERPRIAYELPGQSRFVYEVPG